MPRRWSQFRNAWDREYAMRGALWRGVEDAAWAASWLAPGPLVLELGCGDGKFLAGLRAAGFDAVGLDFARHAMRRARERGAGPFVLGDVRALPLRDASVEAVAARYVLGALDSTGRRLAAAEIERVVAPGGVVLVEEFSTGDFRYGVGRPVEPNTFERNRGILSHYFDGDEAPKLLAGLRLRHIEDVRSVQRTREGSRPRRRWRWVFARQDSPKDSSRAASERS